MRFLLLLLIAVLSRAQSAPAQFTPYVLLSWTESTPGVTGYYIYRSQIDGGPYNLANTTPFKGTVCVDGKVSSGMTYYYVVKSTTASGSTSVYSNQITVSIPPANGVRLSRRK